MKDRRPIWNSLAALLALLPLACGGDDLAIGEPVVVTDTGDVTDGVNAYREMIGATNNGGSPGPFESGRREINWDAVPDNLSAPNFMPADFFNAVAAPRARGAVFEAPGGQGVQVSADSDNPAGAAVRFGNINASYADSFEAFSQERLFSPIGSNVVDLTFFVPGTSTPAIVNGFGAVYTDVDSGRSSFEYFDENDRSLGVFGVPTNNNGLSFLGVVFDFPIVARVRIIYGTSALGPNESATVDVAVMDDFFYGEPQAISAP